MGGRVGVDTLTLPVYHEGIVALSPSAATPVTILDIKNHLYAHFLGATTFSLRDDLKTVQLGKVYDKGGELAAHKAGLVKAALEEMEKAGLVHCLDPEAGVYVLTQPLTSLHQQVVVSPVTANLVAEVFNTFARETGQTEYIANKLAISDIDIATVARVAVMLHDRLVELEDELEGDMGAPPNPENN